MKDETLHKIIIGNLKTAIKAHGPITEEYLESATRRIEHGISGFFKSEELNTFKQKSTECLVLVDKKKFKDMKKQIKGKSKCIRDLLKILKSNGIVLKESGNLNNN